MDLLYPIGGKAVMRSDWSKDQLYLHINNDSARRSHGHADDLSVIVFAYGKYLLADPLYYNYNSGDTTFKTILFPVRVAEDYDIEASEIDTGIGTTKASAMEIEYKENNSNIKTKGIYYNLHDKDLKGQGFIKNYISDGETIYIEQTNNNNENEIQSLSFRDGTHITDTDKEVDLIKSLSNIEGISIRWDLSTIYIDSMNEININDITIYSNSRQTSNVYLNNNPINFKKDGRYIYFGENPIINDETKLSEIYTFINSNNEQEGEITRGTNKIKLRLETNAYYILAIYEDEKLIKTEIKLISPGMTEEERTIECLITETMELEQVEIKVFVIEDLETLKPIFKSFKKNTKD